MDPAPTDREAVTTGGFEVGGDWGQRRRVEMGTASHKADSFLRLNLVCAQSQPDISAGPLVGVPA
jgi:hypothetical protein